MSMWRCPHCGTPQAETARCWVCHRSSTTCSTCRHFRRSVAGQLGYCGLDRRRLPLAGTELRGCWEPGADRPAQFGAARPPAEAPADEPSRLRDFIPVELAHSHGAVATEPDRDDAASAIRRPPIEPAEPWTGGATLFGEADG